MEGSVPKGIIQHTEKDLGQLHQEVSENLGQLGQKTTPSVLNPEDQTPLEKVKKALGETTYVVGSTVTDKFGGHASPDRVTQIGTPSLIHRMRELKQKFSGKNILGKLRKVA